MNWEDTREPDDEEPEQPANYRDREIWSSLDNLELQMMGIQP